MAIFDINWENKPKLVTSLGLILITLSFLYLFGVLWIFDYSSSKYIDTEFGLSEHAGLSGTVVENIAAIQDVRLGVPISLAKKGILTSAILFIGGFACFFVGFFLPWNKKRD